MPYNKEKPLEKTISPSKVKINIYRTRISNMIQQQPKSYVLEASSEPQPVKERKSIQPLMQGKELNITIQKSKLDFKSYHNLQKTRNPKYQQNYHVFTKGYLKKRKSNEVSGGVLGSSDS